jgi:hypothetical protein
MKFQSGYESHLIKSLSDALGYPVTLNTKRPSARERLEKELARLELRQLARIQQGRTRGAGAGGFNRDIDNIVHQINLVRIAIADLERGAAQ